jgi:signal transduction histidine kinase
LRYLNCWFRYMLHLSPGVRLGIVIVVTLLCLAAYVLMYEGIYPGTSLFLGIPIALASWLFKLRGMAVCLMGMLLVILLFHSLYHTGLFLSHQIYIFIALGGFSLLLEGFLTASFRALFDVSDETRQKMATVYEQQQQLNQLREQFIQNVNHELRTPLTSAYGYLELLLVYHEQLDAASRVTFLKNALDSCEELQSLVNNIFDTLHVRHETESLSLEALSVLDVVREVIEHADPRRLQLYALHIQVPEHLVVRANAQYLRQVLRNLLSNATKYAPEHTPIIVSAALYDPPTAHQQELVAQEVCICVKDAGPGIPPEDLPRLFGQFVRLRRDMTSQVPGTGLGLYVSKQFVEAMGGRIWVESAGIPGQGSTFCFTLPYVPRVQAGTT